MRNYVAEIILLNGAKWRFNRNVGVICFIAGLENKFFRTYFEDDILIFEEIKEVHS